MRLRSKVAIVVGTSPNIGGGIAEALAGAGAAVVCVDGDPANASDCAAGIRAAGGSAFGVAADVTDQAQVLAAVRAAEREFGRIDALVNGAVVYNMKGLLTMSVEEFRRQVDLILSGAFLFTKHVAEQMVRQGSGGSIIHIASTEAHQGNPQNVAYCTAKAGLVNMARANAMELAPYKIRVNSLTPTATDPTEAAERAVRWGRPRVDPSGSLPLRRAKLLPLRTAPTPTDYGYAAIYLASDESRLVTGTDLRVDAGALANYWGASAQPDA